MEMVTYPNEGHWFYTVAHQKDMPVRMIAWFNQNLK
jgi:dipeptidyl aminopeptidase/acylaminoacyl peptidase